MAFASEPGRGQRAAGAGDRPLFIYDGGCGFCRGWAGWLEQRVGADARFAPFQALDDLGRFNLTIEDVQAASYLIEDGQPYGGGRGFARAMTHGRGAWKLIGRILDLPGVRWATAISYRFVARNRHLLPAPDRDVTV